MTMMVTCEVIKGRLGLWLDGELGPSETREVEAHLERCPSCLEERRRLERLQAFLEEVLRARAEIAFKPFWQGVERRIQEAGERRWMLLDWVRLAFRPRNLAWAIPVMIVFVFGLLSMGRHFTGWPWGVGKMHRITVESIDGHGHNVALFREFSTRTTVIWLLQNQEDEDETAGGSVQGDQSF